MANGDEVQLGRVRLSVLETPGHSPESISILVFDPEQADDRPHAVLTGDTLFIGDVGRPDVRASLGWSADQLASLLYDSLRDKLRSLPDDALVSPAHGASSLCGKNLSTDTVSTIGVQRAHNYALQPMSRERFIEIVPTDQPDTRAYFTYDAVLNARERPTLADAPERELRPLSLARLLELVAHGAQLLTRAIRLSSRTPTVEEAGSAEREEVALHAPTSQGRAAGSESRAARRTDRQAGG